MTGDASQNISAASEIWIGKGYSSIAVASVSKHNFTVSYYNIHGEMVYTYTRERTMEIAPTPILLPTSNPTTEDPPNRSDDDSKTNTVPLYTLGASLSMLGLFAIGVVTTRLYEKSQHWNLTSLKLQNSRDFFISTPPGSPSKPMHSQLFNSEQFEKNVHTSHRRLRNYGFTISSNAPSASSMIKR